MVEAVLDTGPLIHLDEIRQLDIFTKVFENMYIPEYVVAEISNTSVHTFIENNIDTIAVVKVSEQSIFSAKVATSGFSLHLADLAVIVVQGNNVRKILSRIIEPITVISWI